MNATGTNGRLSDAGLAQHDCGIIPAGQIRGDLPTAEFHCDHCGHAHDFENQGLRATGIDCGSVKFLTLDEIALAS